MVRRFFLLAGLAATASGLFRDQAGELDWRVENVGAVSHAVYQQRRCYALTRAGGGQALVAALNTRTGGVEWRRALPPGEAGDGVVVAGNAAVTLSGRGSRLRAWRLGDGALLWDAAAAGGASGAALLALNKHGAAGVAGSDCVVVALGGDAVAALDCGAGRPVAGFPWYAEPEDDAKLAGALRSGGAKGAPRVLSVVAAADGAGLLAAGLAGDKAWVAYLDPFAKGGGHAEASQAAVVTSGCRDVALASRSGKAPPLLACLSGGDDVKAYDAIAALNKGGAVPPLGSVAGALNGAAADSLAAEPNTGNRVLRVAGGGATRLLGGLRDDEMASGARTPLVALGDGPCGASCAFGAFATPVAFASGGGDGAGRAFYASAAPEAGGVATRVFEVGGAAVGDADVAPLAVAAHGAPAAVFPQVFDRAEGAGLGYRAMVVTAADTVAMVGAAKLSWARDEALAHVTSAAFVDAPPLESAAAPSAGVPSFAARLASQRTAAAAFLGSVCDALFSIFKDAAALKEAKKLANARRYGFDKLAVLANADAGRVFAVGMHTGATAWSALIPKNAAVSVVKRGDRPELGVFARGVGVSYLDAHRGAPIGAAQPLPAADVLIPTRAVDPASGRDAYLAAALEDDGAALEAVPAAAGPAIAASLEAAPLHFHVVDEARGALRCFMVAPGGSRAVELGAVVVAGGPGDAILDVAYGDAGPVSSKAHVLGDDALLLKYLNPHLAVVLSSSPGGAPAPLLDAKLRVADVAAEDQVEPPTLYVTLVDVVKASVAHRVAVPHGGAPAKAILNENWVIYSYWNHKAKRAELGSLSLHEGMIERFGLSPFKVPEQESTASAWSLPPPVALQRTFALPKPVTALGATATSRGIASKHVLLGVEITSSTRLQCERMRRFRREAFCRASRTRRERSIRPKVSRIDFDVTELERFEVCDFGAGAPRRRAGPALRARPARARPAPAQPRRERQEPRGAEARRARARRGPPALRALRAPRAAVRRHLRPADPQALGHLRHGRQARVHVPRPRDGRRRLRLPPHAQRRLRPHRRRLQLRAPPPAPPRPLRRRAPPPQGRPGQEPRHPVGLGARAFGYAVLAHARPALADIGRSSTASGIVRSGRDGVGGRRASRAADGSSAEVASRASLPRPAARAKSSTTTPERPTRGRAGRSKPVGRSCRSDARATSFDRRRSARAFGPSSKEIDGRAPPGVEPAA